MITLVSLGLVALIFAFIGYPLFRAKPPQKVDKSAEEEQLEELLSQRDATYAAIKELEFDMEIGNLSKEDYSSLDQRYKNKALSILKGMDALEKGEGEGVEEKIEREVLRLRQGRDKTATQELVCTSCGAKHRPGDRFCPACGRNLELVCPSCGVKYQQGDRFCSACGRTLSN